MTDATALEEPDIWTPEQVANLNRYQRFGAFHPYTCGSKEKHRQIEHPSGWTETVNETLVATRKGWRCLECDYKQFTADAAMLDFTADKADAIRAQFPAFTFGE